MMRYREALSRCLDAIAEGRDLESVLAELPARHRTQLRRDATLAEAVRRHSATQPVPTAAAEVNALSRLNADLNAARAEREAAAARSSFLGVPRFALAGLVVAALMIGASFVLDIGDGGDGVVEAAEFEGVVVASGDGSLTVQTLDSLEEIRVPLSAQVLDENGSALRLAALREGEVVLVRGNREPGGPVQAFDVRRILDGLPGWCNENPERCRQIAQNLTDAQSRCQQDPRVCGFVHDRVTDLITRVTDVADLEDLKQRCRAGGEGCPDITSFCHEHPDACTRDVPRDFTFDRIEEARERLRELQEQCRNRDTRACRTIAQICAQHAEVCSDLPLPPRAPTTDDAPVGRTPVPSQPIDAQPTPVKTPVISDASSRDGASDADSPQEPHRPDAGDSPADGQPSDR